MRVGVCVLYVLCVKVCPRERDSARERGGERESDRETEIKIERERQTDR